MTLFKVDNGMDIKSTKRTTKEAASQVKTKRTTKIDDEGVSGKILESQVQKMTAKEYEARSEDIMEAIRYVSLFMIFLVVHDKKLLT